MKTNPIEWPYEPTNNHDNTNKENEDFDYDTEDDVLDEDSEAEQSNIGDELEEDQAGDNSTSSIYSIDDLIAKYSISK